MVFKGPISFGIRAYIFHETQKDSCNISKLSLKTGVSVPAIYRIRREGLDGLKEKETRKYSPGRPPKLRTERNIIRWFKKLRSENPNFTTDKLLYLPFWSKLKVSTRTLRRILRKHGYAYRVTRRKGVLTSNDLKQRLAFAKKMKKDKTPYFWTNGIHFY